MTIWPAWQHFEEDQKGSIEAGKIADLVVLSADPTAVDPETLDGLKVLETIKEGRTVFRLDAAAVQTAPLPASPGPALPNLLVALGGPAARPVFTPVSGIPGSAGPASPASATCMSDGILVITRAMLDGQARPGATVR
jgi:hypothetical protein